MNDRWKYARVFHAGINIILHNKTPDSIDIYQPTKLIREAQLFTNNQIHADLIAPLARWGGLTTRDGVPRCGRCFHTHSRLWYNRLVLWRSIRDDSTYKKNNRHYNKVVWACWKVKTENGRIPVQTGQMHDYIYRRIPYNKIRSCPIRMDK